MIANVDVLNLWLIIYGGIVGVFIALAFYNLFTSESKFDSLLKKLEKKLKELTEESNEFKKRHSKIIKENDELLSKQDKKIKEYETIINDKTNFIMDYTSYLTSKEEKTTELIVKFEKHLNTTNDMQKTYEILVDLHCIQYEYQAKKIKDYEDNDTLPPPSLSLKIIDIYIVDKYVEYLNGLILSMNYRYLNQVAIHISNISNILIKYTHRMKNDYFKEIPKINLESLEELHDNYKEKMGLNDISRSNICSLDNTLVFVYTFFLEALIDYQIANASIKSSFLIEDLLELVELLELSEQRMNKRAIQNNFEEIDEPKTYLGKTKKIKKKYNLEKR